MGWESSVKFNRLQISVEPSVGFSVSTPLTCASTVTVWFDVPTVSALLDADPEDAGMRGYAYAIAKRANQLRVKAAAGLWGQRGARINSISPGVISTAMGRAEASDTATGEATSSLIAQSASKRMGTPTEIAAAAEFLLSSNASFITGTDLLVDGGAVAATSAALLPSVT